MKLENSYESQKREKNEFEMKFIRRLDVCKSSIKRCQMMDRKWISLYVKDVWWHFDASRHIISIIFLSFDADKVEEMNHDIIKIDWFRFVRRASSECVWLCRFVISRCCFQAIDKLVLNDKNFTSWWRWKKFLWFLWLLERRIEEIVRWFWLENFDFGKIRWMKSLNW